MDFTYKEAFGPGSRSAYATLLNDCMRGDATLFDRADSVEAAWTLVDPILHAWQNSPVGFPNYRAGSWGRQEAMRSLGARWTSLAFLLIFGRAGFFRRHGRAGLIALLAVFMPCD